MLPPTRVCCQGFKAAIDGRDGVNRAPLTAGRLPSQAWPRSGTIRSRHLHEPRAAPAPFRQQRSHRKTIADLVLSTNTQMSKTWQRGKISRQQSCLMVQIKEQREVVR